MARLADSQTDARADRRGRAPVAAEGRADPPEAALCAPGGDQPARIIIHGNALDRVPETYKRYLQGYFRDAFKLVGTPLAIEYSAPGATPTPRRASG